MKTAKLFANGRSQAVRLPSDCRMSGDEVYVRRLGELVVLIPKGDPWGSLRASLGLFTDDFMAAREQPGHQDRPEL
jgi:antitoxin VapB